MKKNNIVILLLLSISVISCNNDDFLEIRPKKSSDIVPATVADLESVLAGMWRGDNICPELLYGTDEVELSAILEKAQPGTYSAEMLMSALWEREKSGSYKDYMWMYRYQNIFRSNLADFYLPKVGATPDEAIAIKSASAFRRAESYMELLNIYTLPYCEENLQELGLPIAVSTTFDYSLKRATIKDTYKMVEENILEALKTNVDLTQKVGAGSPFRVTKVSANALASRFYLMKHDYENAKKYAQAALNLYGIENIIDYNAIGYSPVVDSGSIKIDGTDINFEVKYPGTYPSYDYINNWNENIFAQLSAEANFAWGFSLTNVASQSLIDCFDTDGVKEMDARFKYFYVQNYAYLNGKPITNPYCMIPQPYTLAVPEALLTIAECEARVGDYNKAMMLVNKLRAKRIDPAGKVNLSATDKDDAIAKVLRERRRELGMQRRMWDLRRHNSNNYANDDVTIIKQFYEYSASGADTKSALKTYTLEPKSRKWAAMIPESDILAGKGQIEQNKY